MSAVNTIFNNLRAAIDKESFELDDEEYLRLMRQLSNLIRERARLQLRMTRQGRQRTRTSGV